MADKRKRRKVSGINANWTKADVESFYEAYRKYGTQWQKVADSVRSKSAQLVEALFKRNKIREKHQSMFWGHKHNFQMMAYILLYVVGTKPHNLALLYAHSTYLELPEGGASVNGLIAMMVDQGVIQMTEPEQIGSFRTRDRSAGIRTAHSLRSNVRPLKNMGNTCFVNAVLQQLALLSAEGIGDHDPCEPLCGGCYLHLVLKKYRNNQKISLNLLRSVLNSFSTDFQTNRQADSAEFWDRAVTFLNVPNFLVYRQNQITCSVCNNTTIPPSTPSQSVLLDVHHRNLVDALTEAFRYEVDYKCSICKESGRSPSKWIFVKLPRILSFHIGRWDASLQKISGHFVFPSSVDLSEFGEGPAYYNLRGVVEHVGVSRSGRHYISYVNDDSTCRVADDEYVVPMPLADVLTVEAFMLIYERSETCEPPEEGESVQGLIPVDQRVVRAPLRRPKRKVFKRKRNRKRSHIYRDIRRLQNSCDLLVPKKPFSNLVKEVTQNNTRNDLKYQRTAILALQEASETCLISLFGDAALCSAHGKRKTLFPKDISLVKDIRSSPL